MKTAEQWFEIFKEENTDENGKLLKEAIREIPEYFKAIQKDAYLAGMIHGVDLLNTEISKAGISG